MISSPIRRGIGAISISLILIATATGAKAGWFEDTWPGVYERFKKYSK